MCDTCSGDCGNCEGTEKIGGVNFPTAHARHETADTLAAEVIWDSGDTLSQSDLRMLKYVVIKPGGLQPEWRERAAELLIANGQRELAENFFFDKLPKSKAA